MAELGTSPVRVNTDCDYPHLIQIPSALEKGSLFTIGLCFLIGTKQYLATHKCTDCKIAKWIIVMSRMVCIEIIVLICASHGTEHLIIPFSQMRKLRLQKEVKSLSHGCSK